MRSVTSLPSGPACARSTLVITSTNHTRTPSVVDAISRGGEIDHDERFARPARIVECRLGEAPSAPTDQIAPSDPPR